MKTPRKPSGTADIYALTDPRDGKIRYIGKATCAHKRFKTHILDARRRFTPVYQWINELAAIGAVPGLMVLETCPSEFWEIREKLWIKEARNMGGFLLNVAAGGARPGRFGPIILPNGTIFDPESPQDRKTLRMKRRVNQLLRQNALPDSDIVLLRECARMVPVLFGCWARL